MNRQIQRDENTEYLINEGATILEYASGYSARRNGYLAIALIKRDDEVLVWSNFQTMDAKRLMRGDDSIHYQVDGGDWDSFDDNDEIARGEYNWLLNKYPVETMSIGEVNETNDAAIHYKGRRYGAWEPNY
jgi:hypothetical protein